MTMMDERSTVPAPFTLPVLPEQAQFGQHDAESVMPVAVVGELPDLESPVHFGKYRELMEASDLLGNFASEEELARVRQDVSQWFVSTGQAELPLSERMSGLEQYLTTNHGLSIKFVDLRATSTFIEAVQALERDKAGGLLPEHLIPDVDPDLGKTLPTLQYVDPNLWTSVLSGMPEYVTGIDEGGYLPQNAPEGRGVGAWMRGIMRGFNGLFHRRRRHAPAIGDSIVNSLVVDPAEEAEYSPIVERSVRISDGRILRFVSYFDTPQHEHITAGIDAGQRNEYVRNGVWKPDAEGHPIRGGNVQILALLDPESNIPVAALRKVHAHTWSEVEGLPSFIKFQEEAALHPDGLALFRDLAQGRPTVEIAGLWKSSGYASDAKVALYRLAIQESMDKGELWFLGVVAPEYKGLRDAYGDRVIRTIGHAITVNDGDATSKTRLRPVVVDPETLYADLLDDAESSAALGDTTTSLVRQQMLWEFLRGRDWSTLNDRVVSRLKELLHV
jgi:hypothetical protein